MNDKILRSYYDLAVAPPSFDICTFLYLSEMERLHRRLDAIDLFVIANTADGFRDDFKFQPQEDNIQRLQKIVLPAYRLLPSCRRVLYFPDRSEAARDFAPNMPIFPDGYTVARPIIEYLDSHVVLAFYAKKPTGSLRAPKDAVKFVTQWIDAHLDGRKPIVITLRESHIQPLRNSDISQWSRFSRWLDPEKYRPVFVPDTASVFRQKSAMLRDFLIFEPAAVDIELRLALYEAAYINLHVDSGPALLCMLDDKTRFIRFKIDPYGNPAAGPHNFIRRGYEKDMQWVHCTSLQRSVWQDDEFGIIVREFQALVERIEAELPVTRMPLPPAVETITRFIAGHNFADSIRLAKLKLATDPDNVELRFLLATALQGSGAFAEAIEVFQSLERLPEAHAVAIIPLATCLWKSGAVEDALSLLDRVGSDEATPLRLLYSIAKLLLDMEAKAALLKIMARILDPNSRTASAIRPVGRESRMSDDGATEAIRIFTRAMEKWPDCVELHFMLDDCLERRAHSSEAI